MAQTSTTTGNRNDAVPPYDTLSARLERPLVTPEDPGYDEARAVYNAMIDRRPAALAICQSSSDVAACVRFAAEHGVELAIRGGGHNAGGLGVWDDALVVDLSAMRAVTVDPTTRTVQVAGGCTWNDVDRATAEHGMATPCGFLSSTGVGGLTLGGGIGYLTRRFGLTVDNLRSAEVVLADGQLATASADSHPDLYWALRGGGGNFGVVTSFTFDCHPIGEQGHRDWRACPLRPRGHSDCDALVSRDLAYASGGTERLDRAHHDPSRAAFPRGAVGSQSLRHRVVLHRTARSCRRRARPHP